MRFKILLLGVSIGAVILALSCSMEETKVQAGSSDRERPNILFVYTDDQAPWALGYSGNEQAITPNMDRLARQGIYFPNAYTSTPVCSPSRAGLLTSRYGYELGIDDWINTSWPSLSGQEPELGLDPSFETWPRILQRRGYTTGLVGKWHLGIQDRYHPTNFGYDEFIGFREGGTSTENPEIETSEGVRKYEGLTADVLTDFALSFIEEKSELPFALSLHYRAPHTQWLPVSEEDAAPYANRVMNIPNAEYENLDKKRVERMMREYLSSVRSIDRNLGRILDKLDELELMENTVVIFTSDHGYNMGHNGIWHKGNGHWVLESPVPGTPNVPENQRPNLYDNSLKVPVIIRWPGVVEEGITSSEAISNLDWFPTIVDIAKGNVDKDTILRGKSFLSVLTGKERSGVSERYAAYTTRHQSITAMRMYSDGKYKLVRDFINKDRDEFYLLETDPAENRNEIDTEDPALRTIIEDFDNRIHERMKETNDPILDRIGP